MEKFKPKRTKSDKVVISIRIENKLLENIDNMSNKNNMSRNEFIAQSLDFALKNIDLSIKDKK